MVSIEVNPNVELISIVLSYTAWFNTFGISEEVNYSYRDDINNSFTDKNLSPAVIQASNLFSLGFSVDFPSTFILHFDSPPNLTLRCNYSDYILTQGGGELRLNAFANALRDFVVETNFTNFFIAHNSFYNAIINNFTTIFNWNDAIITLETFWGLSKSSYTIILAPFMFIGGGFGAWIEDENGTHLYSIIRTRSIKNNMPYFGSYNDVINVVLHEFVHGFINPIVDAHMNQFEQYSDLYLIVEENMTQMLYPNWQTMLQEILIRAFTAWFDNKEFGEVNANEQLDLEEKRGFYFIRDIYDSYFDFMDKRDQYPTFDHFIPEILKVLDELLSQSKSSTNNTSVLNIFEIFLILCLFPLFLRKNH